MSRSSPNAAVASRRAAARSAGRRSAERTVRMPLPPPPAAGLTRSGNPIRSRRDHERVVRLVRVVVPGQRRDPEADGQPAGRGLVAHRPDRVGGRSHPPDAGRGHRLGERGMLGKEPETGMEGVGARGHGRRDDRRPRRGGRPRRVRRSRAPPLRCRVARQVRAMRTAISPRFAMKTVLIGSPWPCGSRTRRSRQTRHANDPRPAAPVRDRRRSSAAPCASTRRLGQRTRSGSAPAPSVA